MKIDPKYQYKSETGNNPFIEFETEHLTGSMDGSEFQDMNGKEIRDALDYDCKKNAKWGVYVENLPKEYQDIYDLKLPTPEYIEWLESKI